MCWVLVKLDKCELSPSTVFNKIIDVLKKEEEERLLGEEVCTASGELPDSEKVTQGFVLAL